MPLQLVLDLFPPVSRAERDGLPGHVAEQGDVPPPAAYVVFDCETTGTNSAEDEIVSLGADPARSRWGGDGQVHEPRAPVAADSRPRRRPCTASPTRTSRALSRSSRSRGSSSTSSTAACSSPTTRASTSECSGTPSRARRSSYEPAAVACTLEAFRLLDPLADNHRLQSLCDSRGIELHDAHDAMSDVLATTALLRVLLDEGIAPETVELDHSAYMRLRSRGDTRPASDPQIRRVFGMARSAGLVGPRRQRRSRAGRRARRAGHGHGRCRLTHAGAGAGRLRRARGVDR